MKINNFTLSMLAFASVAAAPAIAQMSGPPAPSDATMTGPAMPSDPVMTSPPTASEHAMPTKPMAMKMGSADKTKMKACMAMAPGMMAADSECVRLKALHDDMGKAKGGM